MANKRHLAKLKEGIGAWNAWRKEYPETIPDLTGARLAGASLIGADLIGASLIGADLSGADLGGADLGGADLSRADLREADLSRADLSGADLGGASLSGADFRDADLHCAELHMADLSGADLSEALISYTIFGDNDLREVQGLETVRHNGPSSIGIDTIYRSQGKIPEVFLRGAGVPENFIEYMHSLTGAAFEFYSCFISYSTKDQEFAERLYADLQNKGVRCWYAPQKMRGGQKLDEQIDLAIRTHEKLLLVLSPNSINSDWVKREVKKARKREADEHKRVLFPIRLISFEDLSHWDWFEAKTGTDVAEQICEYFIPDFSDWKNHDSYRKAFARLLDDLNATNPEAGSTNAEAVPS